MLGNHGPNGPTLQSPVPHGGPLSAVSAAICFLGYLCSMLLSLGQGLCSCVHISDGGSWITWGSSGCPVIHGHSGCSLVNVLCLALASVSSAFDTSIADIHTVSKQLDSLQVLLRHG
jgi:hypothetical protein